MAPPDYLKSVASTATDAGPDEDRSVDSGAAAERTEAGEVEEEGVAGEPAREEPVDTAPPKAPSQANSQEEARSSRYAIAALIVLAIVLGALLIRSNGLIGVLEGKVAGLEADLGRSRATVAAHEAHLGTIRDEVEDITLRVGALGDLVNQSVSAKPQARPESTESGGSGRHE